MASLRFWAGGGGGGVVLREEPSRRAHMEPLFHGLIWEPERSELGIELWLWLET